MDRPGRCLSLMLLVCIGGLLASARPAAAQREMRLREETRSPRFYVNSERSIERESEIKKAFSEGRPVARPPQVASPAFLHVGDGLFVRRLVNGDVELKHDGSRLLDAPTLARHFPGLLSPGTQNVFVRSPTLYKPLREFLRGRATTEAKPLIIYNRTEQPAENTTGALNRPIRTVTTFHALPRTKEEGVVVHGGQASEYDNDYWAARNAFMKSSVSSATDIRNVQRSGETIATALLRALKEARTTNDLIVILGEVQDGQLRFPDKSTLPVSALDLTGPPVIVLGCNSANRIDPPPGGLGAGLGRRVDYIEAIQLASFIDQASRKSAFTIRSMFLWMQHASEVTKAVVPVTVRTNGTAEAQALRT